MSQLRIGCSGWAYKDWTGPFYPPDVKERARLQYCATRFDTAEINASSYRLPSGVLRQRHKKRGALRRLGAEAAHERL